MKEKIEVESRDTLQVLGDNNRCLMAIINSYNDKLLKLHQKIEDLENEVAYIMKSNYL